MNHNFTTQFSLLHINSPSLHWGSLGQVVPPKHRLILKLIFKDISAAMFVALFIFIHLFSTVYPILGKCQTILVLCQVIIYGGKYCYWREMNFPAKSGQSIICLRDLWSSVLKSKRVLCCQFTSMISVLLVLVESSALDLYFLISGIQNSSYETSPTFCLSRQWILFKICTRNSDWVYFS